MEVGWMYMFEDRKLFSCKLEDAHNVVDEMSWYIERGKEIMTICVILGQKNQNMKTKGIENPTMGSDDAAIVTRKDESIDKKEEVNTMSKEEREMTVEGNGERHRGIIEEEMKC
ncbi:hypothetical protein Tco_0822836 [Tanacetum coccineum]|uniref:Uncharacterized protein n=1 Tax=Tanacetum coccineum TaxID=301880 RepID=A0ABQ5AIT2_9ASTR